MSELPTRVAPYVEYDADADAAYVRISNARVERTEEYEDWLIVDYDADGQPIGVEILNCGHEPWHAPTR